MELAASIGNADVSVIEATYKQYFSVERLLQLLVLAIPGSPRVFCTILHFLWSHHMSSYCRLPLKVRNSQRLFICCLPCESLRVCSCMVRSMSKNCVLISAFGKSWRIAVKSSRKVFQTAASRRMPLISTSRYVSPTPKYPIYIHSFSLSCNPLGPTVCRM